MKVKFRVLASGKTVGQAKKARQGFRFRWPIELRIPGRICFGPLGGLHPVRDVVARNGSRVLRWAMRSLAIMAFSPFYPVCRPKGIPPAPQRIGMERRVPAPNASGRLIKQENGGPSSLSPLKTWPYRRIRERVFH
jgi:hypothetical protein